MYSAYVRLLSFAVEEMAESITDEEGEYLKKKFEGTTLQKILYESSVDEVLGYILCTKKQRETLKKYGPDTKRAELKFLAYLHLEASLNMFQALSVNSLLNVSGKAMLEQAVRTRSGIMHPELSSPLDCPTEKYEEMFDFLEKVTGVSLKPPPD